MRQISFYITILAVRHGMHLRSKCTGKLWTKSKYWRFMLILIVWPSKQKQRQQHKGQQKDCVTYRAWHGTLWGYWPFPTFPASPCQFHPSPVSSKYVHDAPTETCVACLGILRYNKNQTRHYMFSLTDRKTLNNTMHDSFEDAKKKRKGVYLMYIACVCGAYLDIWVKWKEIQKSVRAKTKFFFSSVLHDSFNLAYHHLDELLIVDLAILINIRLANHLIDLFLGQLLACIRTIDETG